MTHRIPALARLASPLLGALCLSSLHVHAANADYRVQQGDSIEVSVAGLPDLRKRAIVGMDGQLALPLIGEVPAAGSTLPQLRKRVRELFQAQAHRNRAGGSATSTDVILESEVSVDIVEYRPVYITGGVANPGAQAFRPGLTLGQALAMAGGYGPSGAAALAARIKLVSLESERAAAAIEHERESARLARVEAELEGQVGTQDALALDQAPEGISAAEQKLQSVRTADHKAERETLTRALTQAQARTARLTQQFEAEQKGADADELELQKVEGLSARGLVTNTRVVEARRFVLLSSTRALQTGTQMDYARREVEDLRSRLERLTPQRHIALLGDLQNARVRVGALNASLESISRQIALADPANLSGGGQIGLTITRVTEEGSLTRTAQEDEPLHPGDIVTAQAIAAAGPQR